MSKEDRTEEQVKIAPEREKFINDLVAALNGEGMPGEMVQLFSIQADTCYACFLLGNAVAKRLIAEGEVEQERQFEVAMEFTKILTQKITIKQQQSQLAQPAGPLVLGNIPPGIRH